MCESRADAKTSAWTMADLNGAERALVTATRLWFRTGTAAAMGTIRDTLRRAGIGTDALLPLFALLGTLSADGTRNAEIRCPACTRLSQDEAALLDALAALQDGDEDGAADALDHWLPLVALCLATASARTLVDGLAAAGLRLSRRGEPVPDALRIAAE